MRFLTYEESKARQEHWKALLFQWIQAAGRLHVHFAMLDGDGDLPTIPDASEPGRSVAASVPQPGSLTSGLRSRFRKRNRG